MGRRGRRASQASGARRRACGIERDLVCAESPVDPVLELNEGEAQSGRGSREESDPFSAEGTNSDFILMNLDFILSSPGSCWRVLGKKATWPDVSLSKILVTAEWVRDPSRARGKATPSGRWLLKERGSGAWTKLILLSMLKSDQVQGALERCRQKNLLGTL